MPVNFVAEYDNGEPIRAALRGRVAHPKFSILNQPTKLRAPFIHSFTVKFHEILYTLFSRHPLQVWVQRSTVHCSGPLSAEVDFANQGLAVKDQYALVKPLDLDHLSAQSLAHLPGCVIDVNVALGVDFP